MRDDLSGALVSHFPDLFSGIDRVDVGDGWFVLLWTLCRSMDARVGVSGHVVFDTLRQNRSRLQIDVVAGDSGALALVDYAIRMSGSVCEACGTPGRTTKQSGGWMVLCETLVSLSEPERAQRFEQINGALVRQLLSAGSGKTPAARKDPS